MRLGEVGVEELPGDRMELVFLHQHAHVTDALELEGDQRIDARVRAQDVHQRLRIHRE
jgi:hypothetical protein